MCLHEVFQTCNLAHVSPKFRSGFASPTWGSRHAPSFGPLLHIIYCRVFLFFGFFLCCHRLGYHRFLAMYWT